MDVFLFCYWLMQVVLEH